MRRLSSASTSGGRWFAITRRGIAAAARVACLTVVAACLLFATAAAAQREGAQARLERAVADFLAGNVAAAVAGFDQVVAAAPAVAPQLWQRGIALYYAGRYRDCRAQFESHRLVNPNDVENAAWHYLCVARAESPARAKELLLPV